jgi:hypothetical protein
MIRWPIHRVAAIAFAVLASVLPLAASAASGSFIGGFNTISTVASTVPGNGDVNPYGEVLVPTSVGNLVAGNILVSNFNNSANLQGTGTTIVQIEPDGDVSTFAHIAPSAVAGKCPGGVGLTGALAVLQHGWVIVGSLPTSDGTAATAKAGCLIVLNSVGGVVETFVDSGINGPWGMTALDNGATAALFVSNVLNGTVAANGNVVTKGTILRLNLSVPNQGAGMPSITANTTIGSGFSERTDVAALVIGPQGLGLSGSTLYIADGVNNRIAAIANAPTRTTSAGTGTTITRIGSISFPIGLTIAPNGDILTTNGNNGFLVETAPSGQQVARKLIDNTGVPQGVGCLFDLLVAPGGTGVYYVDDCSNTLNLLN